MLYGPPESLRLAADFWSLRALGARPNWLDDAALAEDPPQGVHRLVLHAPEASVDAIQTTLARWSQSLPSIFWSRQEPSRFVPVGRAYFSSHTEAISNAEDEELFFSTATPPAVDGRIRSPLFGVVEVTINSHDDKNPDGLILTRNEASRRLLQGPEPHRIEDRVTVSGVAGVQPIERASLLSIPNITYKQAVAAPFVEAGYSVSASDKGRYQQRSLQLARGLRYLAACFKQRESSLLLDLFFEHHLGQSAADSYRRAVTFEDLRARLIDLLHERRKRLSRPLLEKAEAWLLEWTDTLLERGLLIGGYVLACSHCAHRAWYRLDDLSQIHSCERCAASSHIPANAIRSFRLNEAFYQLRLNNGEVVTLLLAALRESARLSLLYLPEAALSHPEAKDGEADVLALIDGKLVLAEAKSNNEISSKEAKWYQYVARRTRAKSLIFATTDRTKPLCSNLECSRCRDENGPHHRDYVWNDASRARIQKVREEFQGQGGTQVETFCYAILVSPVPLSDYKLTRIV
jgi:hypothetical protein